MPMTTSNTKISKAKTSPKSKSKPSSVRHTRAIALHRQVAPPAPAPVAVEQLLLEVTAPATLQAIAHYQRLGLRSRTLTLPICSLSF